MVDLGPGDGMGNLGAKIACKGEIGVRKVVEMMDLEVPEGREGRDSGSGQVNLGAGLTDLAGRGKGREGGGRGGEMGDRFREVTGGGNWEKWGWGSKGGLEKVGGGKAGEQGRGVDVVVNLRLQREVEVSWRRIEILGSKTPTPTRLHRYQGDTLPQLKLLT
ncbi:hypothetical protein ACH5RR_007559 [Cinchona calisaya]|uniref:Uncharacterized protein n=1 Tax=Cinchona calisaya TaxID=153742 RepID=A0ABD3AS59_9GENT